MHPTGVTLLVAKCESAQESRVHRSEIREQKSGIAEFPLDISRQSTTI